MNRPGHWLVRLYPRVWRERYGDELQDLIEAEGTGFRAHFDIVKAALDERLFDRSSLQARQAGRGALALTLRTPSALIPLIMSAMALLVVLSAVIAFGMPHRGDEGATAHLFQLLIVGQVPFLVWFHALRHRTRRMVALGLHVTALAVALCPVWYLGL
jgi:hypothetical protein